LSSIKAKLTTSVKVPAGPGDTQLLRAALIAASQANTAQMLEDEALPCCSQCAGLDLVEPPEYDHARRVVNIRGVREVLASGAGTCAELASIDAGAQNKRLLAGESGTAAECEIIEDARGPGRHHVRVLKTSGAVTDHAMAKEGDCGCS